MVIGVTPIDILTQKTGRTKKWQQTYMKANCIEFSTTMNNFQYKLCLNTNIQQNFSLIVCLVFLELVIVNPPDSLSEKYERLIEWIFNGGYM